MKRKEKVRKRKRKLKSVIKRKEDFEKDRRKNEHFNVIVIERRGKG